MIVAAMESRKPDKVFVRVPNERGRWVYTDGFSPVIRYKE